MVGQRLAEEGGLDAAPLEEDDVCDMLSFLVLYREQLSTRRVAVPIKAADPSALTATSAKARDAHLGTLKLHLCSMRRSPPSSPSRVESDSVNRPS